MAVLTSKAAIFFMNYIRLAYNLLNLKSKLLMEQLPYLASLSCKKQKSPFYLLCEARIRESSSFSA